MLHTISPATLCSWNQLPPKGNALHHQITSAFYSNLTLPPTKRRTLSRTLQKASEPSAPRGPPKYVLLTKSPGLSGCHRTRTHTHTFFLPKRKTCHPYDNDDDDDDDANAQKAPEKNVPNSLCHSVLQLQPDAKRRGVWRGGGGRGQTTSAFFAKNTISDEEALEPPQSRVEKGVSRGFRFLSPFGCNELRSVVQEEKHPYSATLNMGGGTTFFFSCFFECISLCVCVRLDVLVALENLLKFSAQNAAPLHSFGRIYWRH